jgi:hypothetical protein
MFLSLTAQVHAKKTIAAFENWFALQREMLDHKISYAPTQDLHVYVVMVSMTKI